MFNLGFVTCFHMKKLNLEMFKQTEYRICEGGNHKSRYQRRNDINHLI